MEDIHIFIFALLFLLVIILILLHRSNKKFADKISILEQTVELKAESLSSMKEIYAESKKVLAKSKEQQKDIERKEEVILALEETKVKLKTIIDNQNEEKEQLKRSHEDVIVKVTEKIVALEYSTAKNESIANEFKVKYKETVQKAENSRHIFEQKAETLLKEKNLRIKIEAKLQEYEEIVKDFNKEKTLHDEKIIRLQKTISDTERKMVELNKIQESTVKQSKDKIFSLEQSLEAKKEIITKLESNNEERLKQIKTLEKTLKEKTETIIQYEKRDEEAINENTKLLSTLKKTIEEKDAKIIMLESAHQDLLVLEKSLKLEKESVEEELKGIVTKNDEILKQLNHDMVTNERQYEELIISLKKELQTKDDMMKKLQNDHKTSKEEHNKETRMQKAKMLTLSEEIKYLKKKDQQIQIAFEKEIQILENVVEHQDKSISELEFSQKDKDDEISKMDVMYYISEGQSKEIVAKQFGIPVKMIDLIIKFDKIKKEKITIS